MTKNEFIRKWYDALRSGKYKQGYGMLRTKDGYCCLGVACSISGQGKWVKDGWRYSYETDTTSNSTSLPEFLSRMMGLSNKLEMKLASMNDSQEVSFRRIAAFIRKKFPEAFPKTTSRKISR